MTQREIYLEILAVGQALRVAAIDAETAEEVVFQVPKHASRSEIERLAVAKVEWKLKRLAGEGDSDPEKKRPDTGSGRGIRV